jgi:hypothetical protein
MQVFFKLVENSKSSSVERKWQASKKLNRKRFREPQTGEETPFNINRAVSKSKEYKN